ncbi:protein of unknown function (plasmid) [Azospirillum lipoferum 4B]|uniref:Uncharacterized protein n=1 Tax=Azospirillum lipoferum (strain 4B) TaxID=862719 RepID=G7ZI11_AZOL4|nr:protein of unknown function [Azospirillum lipoferum 4B]
MIVPMSVGAVTVSDRPAKHATIQMTALNGRCSFKKTREMIATKTGVVQVSSIAMVSGNIDKDKYINARPANPTTPRNTRRRQIGGTKGEPANLTAKSMMIAAVAERRKTCSDTGIAPDNPFIKPADRPNAKTCPSIHPAAASVLSFIGSRASWDVRAIKSQAWGYWSIFGGAVLKHCFPRDITLRKPELLRVMILTDLRVFSTIFAFHNAFPVSIFPPVSQVSVSRSV